MTNDQYPTLLAVYFLNSTFRLNFKFLIEEKINEYNTTEELNEMEVTEATIIQVKEKDGSYFLKIYLNDTLIHSVQNVNPKLLKDLTFYTSNPWNEAAAVVLRDLKYYFVEGLKQINNMPLHLCLGVSTF